MNQLVNKIPFQGSAFLIDSKTFRKNDCYSPAIGSSYPEGIIQWNVNPNYLNDAIATFQAFPSISKITFGNIDLAIDDVETFWLTAFSIHKYGTADKPAYKCELDFAIDDEDYVHNFELHELSIVDINAIVMRPMTEIEIIKASNDEALPNKIRKQIEFDYPAGDALPEDKDDWLSLFMMKDGSFCLSTGISEHNKNEIVAICDLNLFSSDLIMEFNPPLVHNNIYATLYPVIDTGAKNELGVSMFESCTTQFSYKLQIGH